jgi:hypothetical protein
MGADYFFRMGSTHAICQDYALAGEVDGVQYALLADGCSGVPIPGQPGSPYTDWGARFLVRAAWLRLAEIAQGDFLNKSIIHHAASMARAAELPPVCLDATLLAAVRTPDGGVSTYQTGDGVIAGRKRDGSIYYRTLRFGSGMPFYLSYTLNDSHLRAYLDPEARVGLNLPDAGTVQVIENQWHPRDGWSPPFEGRSESLAMEDLVRRVTFPKEEFEVVALLSDGVESFLTRDQNQVALEMVLEQLLDFKGFVGQFAVRRCTRFLEKFCQNEHWRHGDDFSMAAIHLGAL